MMEMHLVSSLHSLSHCLRSRSDLLLVGSRELLPANVTFAAPGDLLFQSSNGEQKVALLLGYVLDCMQKIFLYDTQRFLSKERADTLAGPLLDQVRLRPLRCSSRDDVTAE